MSEGFDFPAFQAAVTEKAADILTSDRSASGEAAAARAVQEFAETTLKEYQQDLGQIACRAGCGHCCQVNVAVLPAEAETIIAYLQTHLSPAEVTILREKARTLHIRVGGLSDDERLMARASCLFLDPWENCGIYQVRPLLCRSLTSIDPEDCRDAVNLAALEESASVTCHLFQQELFQQAFCGLAEALEERGLEHRSDQLTEVIWQRLS